MKKRYLALIGCGGLIAISIVLFIIIGIASLIFGDIDKEENITEEEQTEVTQDNDQEEEPKQEETEEKQEEADEPKEEPKEEKDKVVKVNKEFELDKVNIGIENVYIEDNKLRFGFWWNHWASNDKIHLLVLVYPVVTQNGEELEAEDNGTLLRQTAKGVDSRVDLEYELIDDSPIEIKFITTSDEPKEETITIDIK